MTPMNLCLSHCSTTYWKSSLKWDQAYFGGALNCCTPLGTFPRRRLWRIMLWVLRCQWDPRNKCWTRTPSGYSCILAFFWYDINFPIRYFFPHQGFHSMYPGWSLESWPWGKWSSAGWECDEHWVSAAGLANQKIPFKRPMKPLGSA